MDNSYLQGKAKITIYNGSAFLMNVDGDVMDNSYLQGKAKITIYNGSAFLKKITKPFNKGILLP